MYERKICQNGTLVEAIRIVINIGAKNGNNENITENTPSGFDIK